MEEVELSKVLLKEAVVLDQYTFDSKEEMFDLMASKFIEAGIISDKEKFIESLKERECIGPTYMGNLIGLPHGKSDVVIKPGIGFCKCKVPFTYKSCGEEGQVKYVFMLAIAGTQTGDEYMRILARLAGLLMYQEFLDELDLARSYKDVLRIIEEYEKRGD